MTTYSLSVPRLNFSVTFPDLLQEDFLYLFAPFIKKIEPATFNHRVRISQPEQDYILEIDDEKYGKHKTAGSLFSCLEHFIRELLIKGIDDWIAFHAGSVGIRGEACLILGQPEAGKSTTTFQFVELGALFLSEEIAVVDAERMLVYPFPRALSLDSSYVNEFQSLSPLSKGQTSAWSGTTVRYKPEFSSIAKRPLPLKTILFPEYDLIFKPELIPVSPGEVLTEALRCCYPPNDPEEKLFDRVIEVLESCQIFRLRTNGIKTTKNLIKNILRSG